MKDEWDYLCVQTETSNIRLKKRKLKDNGHDQSLLAQFASD
jgi:hypothetical protein